MDTTDPIRHFINQPSPPNQKST